jgi:hypothetical protein
MLAKVSLKISIVALAASIALTASSARGEAASAPSSAVPVDADVDGRQPSVPPSASPVAHADPQSTLSALHANPRTPGGANGAGQTKMDDFHAMTTDGFGGMQMKDAAALIASAGQPLQ